jgi:hypothetical protein
VTGVLGKPVAQLTGPRAPEDCRRYSHNNSDGIGAGIWDAAHKRILFSGARLWLIGARQFISRRASAVPRPAVSG